jgi:hypothetical protein
MELKQEQGRECTLDKGLQERVRIMRFAGGNRFGEKEGGMRNKKTELHGKEERSGRGWGGGDTTARR